ncbi:hypothetical protein CHS0354_036982 [Potamilus streckersoni]|uniref:Uncharacterized protein n=1 Tax=Potamilus streckersoni TaxID=2493646 RepID=A0AAE0STZ7_9BIVA|nr:hypothetical protein CHS0354_036982 [Potamilus streckersoni]
MLHGPLLDTTSDSGWTTQCFQLTPRQYTARKCERTTKFEGLHHRLNLRAGHTGLGFDRLVPLLRREADLVRLAVQFNDLERDGRSYRLENALNKLWDRYMNHEIKTSKFFLAP